MESAARSNNDNIPTIPVVQATTQDIKCFVSFIHNRRCVLLRDAADFLAPPRNGLTTILRFQKRPIWKWKDEFCLNRHLPPLRSSKWRNLISVRFERAEVSLFKTAAALFETTSSWHPKQAVLLGLIRYFLRLRTKHICHFLTFHPKIDSSMDDASYVCEVKFEFWKLMHEPFKQMTSEFWYAPVALNELTDTNK